MPKSACRFCKDKFIANDEWPEDICDGCNERYRRLSSSERDLAELIQRIVNGPTK